MSVRKVTWTNKTGKSSERWLVDYVDQDGTRCAKNFKTKKDADHYHAQVNVEVAQGVHTAPSKSPTVAEAAEKWLQRIEAKKREQSTIRQYQQHRDHIVKRIGSVKLAQLTPGRVEDFRDRLQLELSRPLARKVLTSFKSILKVNKRSHVAADVSIERDKREDHVEVGRDLPSNSEVKRLIEAMKGNDPRAARMRALLLTAAFTGLRASELRGLRWEDVDMKAAVLQVRQRADRYNKIGKPKSAKSRRTIPLDTENLHPCPAAMAHGVGIQKRLGISHQHRRRRAPQKYGSQPRAGHEGGQGRQQRRRTKICPTCLPPLLCKLVPEH